MSRTTTLDALAGTLRDTANGRRLLVGVAGPPGVGKTTTCDLLADRLNVAEPGCCGVLAMDGYHYDDMVLAARGDRPRKGAPHTFDLGGFAAMIQRLRQDDGADIAVPVFDRSIEIARAGSRIIAGTTRIVVVEGNYVLLDAPGWRDLKAMFDISVMLAADEAVLESRLRERWKGFGLAGEELARKMEGNDLPNLRLVLRTSLEPDYVLRTDD